MGYDGHCIAKKSRPLTTCAMLIGPLHIIALPQGHCNLLTKFQCCFRHAIQAEILHHADAFVDDTGIKGPSSHYDDKLISPGI